MTDLRKQARGPRMVNGEKRDCEIKVMCTHSEWEEAKRIAKEGGKALSFYGYEGVVLQNRLHRAGIVPVGDIEHVRQLALGVQSAFLAARDYLDREGQALGIIALAADREIAAAELEAEAQSGAEVDRAA